MMKKLFFLLSLMQFTSYSQIIATVDENGKKVILSKDGTWKYKSQPKNKVTEGTGIWAIKYFVDDFGDPTDEGYIAHDYYIRGTFSNSATNNSNLNVYFLISGPDNIAVRIWNMQETILSKHTVLMNIKLWLNPPMELSIQCQVGCTREGIEYTLTQALRKTI